MGPGQSFQLALISADAQRGAYLGVSIVGLPVDLLATIVPRFTMDWTVACKKKLNKGGQTLLMLSFRAIAFKLILDPARSSTLARKASFWFRFTAAANWA